MLPHNSSEQPSDLTQAKVVNNKELAKSEQDPSRDSTSLRHQTASPDVILDRAVSALIAKVDQARQLDQSSMDVRTVAPFIISQLEILSDLLRVTEKINTLAGKAQDDREVQAARIALAFQKIAALHGQEKLNPGRKFLSTQQQIFGVACQNNPQGIGSQSLGETLAWYKQLGAQLRIVSINDKFPEMLAYLHGSPSTRLKARELTNRLNDAQSRQSEAMTRRTDAAKRDRDQAASDMRQIRQEITGLFNATKTIDLLKVPGLSENIEVEVAVDDRILEASARLIDDFGSYIAAMCSSEASNETRKVRLPIFSLDSKSRVTSEVRTIEIAPLSTSDLDNTLLARLLDAYLDLQALLLDTFDTLHLNPAREIAWSTGMTALRTSLRSVFPGPFKKTCEIINLLDSAESPQLAVLTGKLLTSRTLSTKDTEPLELQYILQRKEGLELVVTLSRRLLFDKEVLAPEIVSNLRTSEIGPIFAKCEEVRERLQGSHFKELSVYLDESVKKQISGRSSFIENVCLLGILSALAHDSRCARALKVRLTSIDLVPKLCQSILGDSSKPSAALASLVEGARALIGKNLSYNLDDYLGQQQLKETVTSMFAHNLMTLKRLEHFPSVPAKLALFNGFLLYGLPGTGKTFLVQCLANQVGLPLIKISREEMAKALSQSEPKQDKAEGIGRFLAGKADEARGQMRINGAPASIIFVDEMESLFLKRDPATSSREELDETNQMLRILESVMEKHHDIFFMAATNNIHFVDPAALRVGRFGIHLQLKPATREDAKALFRGVCEMLDLSFDELSACPSFGKLCELCCGMVPFPIQNAIINRYVACKSPPRAPSELIEMFAESVQLMRELTTNNFES